MSSAASSITTNWWQCGKCGSLYPQGTGCEKCNASHAPFVLTGWVCPVCNRALAPFVSECNHGKISDFTITSSEIKY